MIELLDRRLTALVLAITPNWCRPNHITGIRIVLIPLVWILYYFVSPWTAVAMFTFLALTDFVDGRLARARRMETRKGKVFDIICDLILVWSTVGLLFNEEVLVFEFDSVLVWLLSIILLREVVVTLVRLATRVKAGSVKVLLVGKCKTGFFMAGITVLLSSAVWVPGIVVGTGLLGIATVCSLFSGAQYVHQFVSRYIRDRR